MAHADFVVSVIEAIADELRRPSRIGLRWRVEHRLRTTFGGSRPYVSKHRVDPLPDIQIDVDELRNALANSGPNPYASYRPRTARR